MNNKKPLISVIMPVYNAGNFLVDAIESLRMQTYKHWELIAVDDASTDNSLSILRSYAKKDKRIKVYENSINLGVGATGNIAIKHAKGDFIARQDADDMSVPTRLEKLISYLLSHPKTVVVGGSLRVIDSSGNRIGVMKYPNKFETIKEMMFVSMPVSQPVFMVNRRLLPKDFVWYDCTKTVAEEVELLFKLFQYGNASNLSDILLNYRVHGKNTSLVSPKKTFYTTFWTRVRAIGRYGYRPSFKGVAVSLAQYIVVSIVPGNWIYPLYSLLRGLKKLVVGIVPNISLQIVR